jgi:hypothetical protein
MFDVFGWWRVVGRNKLKSLEICVLIILANPIHNGFQEKVFSGGTFTMAKKDEGMYVWMCNFRSDKLRWLLVDKYMSIIVIKETVLKKVITERLETFWSTNKKLEDSLKLNLSDDDNSSDEEEYAVEIDDKLDANSDDGYMSDE